MPDSPLYFEKIENVKHKKQQPPAMTTASSHPPPGGRRQELIKQKTKSWRNIPCTPIEGSPIFHVKYLAHRTISSIEQQQERSQRSLNITSSSSLPPPPPSSLPSEKNHLLSLLFYRKISILLIFLPFGYLSHTLQWPPPYIFWFNFLSMIPLASILSEFTEEIATHTNQTIGGLINATFGNAVEVVVAIQALQANEIRVVQASLLGSILSNLLLVLGSSMFLGGMYYKEQRFNTTAAQVTMNLLCLASVGMVLPTPFAAYYDVHEDIVLIISRIVAVFLLGMYFQLLVFQLWTHVDLFEDDDDNEDEEETAGLSLGVALLGLLGATCLVTIFSDYLVTSIDGYVNESGMSRTFVGIVLLPVIGNAVEHITAVSVAIKNKLDLSMGIAIGSSTQVALFVVPLCTLIGWGMGKDMTLNFPHFEIILYVLSIITASICIQNDTTNWLCGALLITTYITLGVGLWFETLVYY